MVSSEGKAKSGIARKGDRGCCSGNVFCCGVFVLVGLCEGCSEQSEWRVILLLVRRDACVCDFGALCGGIATISDNLAFVRWLQRRWFLWAIDVCLVYSFLWRFARDVANRVSGWRYFCFVAKMLACVIFRCVVWRYSHNY